MSQEIGICFDAPGVESCGDLADDSQASAGGGLLYRLVDGFDAGELDRTQRTR